MNEIEEAIQEIAEFPTRYEIYDGDIRVKRTHTHPYSIFYRIKPDHVEILSVSHDAREEGYWKNRT